MELSFQFYLMGKKGYDVLNWFCNLYPVNEIKEVRSEIDEGMKQDYFEQIRQLCKSRNIPFSSRKSPKVPHQSTYRFVIGWRWMLEPAENTIVLHDSILPKYRGFAPVVNALINGEEEIGASAIFAREDYDTGPLICQKAHPLQYPIKITDAINIISNLYIDIMDEIMTTVHSGAYLASIPQDESEASYSLWRDEQDYQIDWTLDNATIKRTVDALAFPFGSAFTMLNNKKVIVEEVDVVDDVKIENRVPGKVIFVKDGFPFIVCGTGLIKITGAYWHNNQKSVLPLTSFRSRFT